MLMTVISVAAAVVPIAGIIIAYKRGSKDGYITGYTSGYKDARLEYRDTIRKQKLQLIKFEAETRAPLAGQQEYKVDFTQSPVTMEHVAITSVTPSDFLTEIKYKHLGSDEILTGTLARITIIIPECAQEC
jgi:hypothetical protein